MTPAKHLLLARLRTPSTGNLTSENLFILPTNNSGKVQLVSPNYHNLQVEVNNGVETNTPEAPIRIYALLVSAEIYEILAPIKQELSTCDADTYTNSAILEPEERKKRQDEAVLRKWGQVAYSLRPDQFNVFGLFEQKRDTDWTMQVYTNEELPEVQAYRAQETPENTLISRLQNSSGDKWTKLSLVHDTHPIADFEQMVMLEHCRRHTPLELDNRLERYRVSSSGDPKCVQLNFMRDENPLGVLQEFSSVGELLTKAQSNCSSDGAAKDLSKSEHVTTTGNALGADQQEDQMPHKVRPAL